MAKPFSLFGLKTLLLAVFLSAILAGNLSAASPKLALVIGNSTYRTGPLLNPGNDAGLVAETLSGLGFDVILHEDLTYRDFARVVADFGRSLAERGPDAVGVFFYAGHAVQSDGVNYLIPVDVDIQDELDLTIQTVPMSLVMQSLEQASNRLNLVFLDACRNNPFRSLVRSGGGGLARLDAPYGTLISYSTAPGAVAADGRGRNSPYSSALARAMKLPGLTVEQALKQVRLSVVERTNGNQIPWESSSLIGDFFFAGSTSEVTQPESAASAVPEVPETTDRGFGPNSLPGVDYGGVLTFKALMFSEDYVQSDHTNYRVTLGGVTLDGEKTYVPFFSVFTDFSSEPKSTESLSLMRLVIQQRLMLSEESRSADYSPCKGGFRLSPSGKKTVRLFLYDSDNPQSRWPNFCVLDRMHEQDQRLWGAILENVGEMLNKADVSDPSVAELVTYYSEYVDSR